MAIYQMKFSVTLSSNKDQHRKLLEKRDENPLGLAVSAWPENRHLLSMHDLHILNDYVTSCFAQRSFQMRLPSCVLHRDGNRKFVGGELVLVLEFALERVGVGVRWS